MVALAPNERTVEPTLQGTWMFRQFTGEGVTPSEDEVLFNVVAGDIIMGFLGHTITAGVNAGTDLGQLEYSVGAVAIDQGTWDLELVAGTLFNDIDADVPILVTADGTIDLARTMGAVTTQPELRVWVRVFRPFAAS